MPKWQKRVDERMIDMIIWFFIGLLGGFTILIWQIKARNYYPLDSITYSRSSNLLPTFRKGGKEIRYKIVSGNLAHIGWNDEDTVKAIEKPLKEGCTITIIIGPTVDEKSKGIFELKSKYPDSLELRKVSKWPDEHFRIKEKKEGEKEEYEIWVEAPHPENFEPPWKVFHSKNKQTLQVALKKFDTLYKQSTIVSAPL